MNNKIKNLIIGGTALVVAGGVFIGVAGGIMNNSIEIEEGFIFDNVIPEYVDLPISKDEIIGVRTIILPDKVHYRYAYTGERVDNLPNEIVSKRNNTARFFSTENGNYRAIVYSGDPQFYKENDKWFYVEYGSALDDRTDPDEQELPTPRFTTKKGFKFLAQKADAITISPQPGSSDSAGVDCTASNNGASVVWSTVIARAGNANNGTNATDGAWGYFATVTTNQFQFIFMSRFSFDTSFLDSADDVASSSINLKGAIFQNQAAFNRRNDTTIVTSNPSDATLCQNSDLDNRTSTLATDTYVDTSAISTGSYNQWDLNAAGLDHIDDTGITTYTSTLRADVTDTSPPWLSNTFLRFDVYMADSTGTSNDPFLELILIPISKVPAIELPGGGNIDIKGNLELR